MTPAEFNALHFKKREEGAPNFAKNIVRHFETKDGIQLSVQATSGHQCSPKESGLPSYTHFEVAIYSQEAFPPFGEPVRVWGKTKVYHQVPVEVICDFINEHGGLLTG